MWDEGSRKIPGGNGPWKLESMRQVLLQKNILDKGSTLCSVLVFIPNLVPYFLALATDSFCTTWLYICCKDSFLNRGSRLWPLDVF